jgi:hypothetical protein
MCRRRQNAIPPSEESIGLTLQEWILQWRGTGTSFEIVPVVPSADTQAVVAPHLGSARDDRADG